MDIQVGDRVTYRIIVPNEIIKTLVADNRDVNNIQEDIKENRLEILKIERIGENGWYIVYKKKRSLLTDEEKEFLKDMCKYHDVGNIRFNQFDINFYKRNTEHVLNCPDYPKNLKFKNFERHKKYTLKELGLEEEA